MSAKEPEPALEVTGLSKRFGHTLALHEVSFRLRCGEALALLGPNGAGKTTLLRACSTLLRPTAGAIKVFGIDPWQGGASARRRIGLLSHESYLYADLTVGENLRFYARLYAVPDYEQRIRALSARLNLDVWLQRPVRTLSRGTVQRAALARVLIHDPDLLFLDEPFTGLDAGAADALSQTLHEARRRGTTIVMSTHDLERALDLCERAIVLVAGKVKFCEPLPAARGEFVKRYRSLISAPTGCTPT